MSSVQEVAEIKLGRSFPLVCIGISAGGLSPLKELFRTISPNTGMAFIIVHHLRKTQTQLPEILANCTTMAVELAHSGMAMRPNHVYVLPSGKELTTADGFFLLKSRSKLRGFSNVFTVFLNSLLKSNHTAVAVILSGMDEDGAAALEAFQQNGGITIVQAPESAEYDGMPRSAIRTGHVDYVLAPPIIAGQLEKLAEEFKQPQVL